jgi:DegV family protein with EDD domain
VKRGCHHNAHKLPTYPKEKGVSKIAIVTDSCASIPEAFIEKLNIYWVPYYIHWGKEILRDLVTIKRDAFYRWLPTLEMLPTTASPGPGDYLELYQSLVEQSGIEQIVSIHMTSKGSGAYQAASSAKSIMKDILPNVRVEVIDTLNVSLCHGWMVIEAARAVLAGKGLSDILSLVQQMIPVTHMIQTADTLKYLAMGGRIGRAAQLLGSILNIKPLIGMEDGVIVPLGKARSRKQAYEKMVASVEEALGKVKAFKVAFVHAAAREEAERLKSLLEQRLNPVESLIAELSPALGVHTGPGTVGLCYFPVLG